MGSAAASTARSPTLQPYFCQESDMALPFVTRALIGAVLGAQAVLVGAFDNSRFDNVSPSAPLHVMCNFQDERSLIVACMFLCRWQCENV